MARIRLENWMEGERRVFRLVGTFEGKAVHDLFRLIRRERKQDIVIDVGLVRGFDEVGVAALARLVASKQDRRIALRGLSTHQLRILRYLSAGLSKVAGGDAP